MATKQEEKLHRKLFSPSLQCYHSNGRTLWHEEDFKCPFLEDSLHPESPGVEWPKLLECTGYLYFHGTGNCLPIRIKGPGRLRKLGQLGKSCNAPHVHFASSGTVCILSCTAAKGPFLVSSNEVMLKAEHCADATIAIYREKAPRDFVLTTVTYSASFCENKGTQALVRYSELVKLLQSRSSETDIPVTTNAQTNRAEEDKKKMSSVTSSAETPAASRGTPDARKRKPDLSYLSGETLPKRLRTQSASKR